MKGMQKLRRSLIVTETRCRLTIQPVWRIIQVHLTFIHQDIPFFLFVCMCLIVYCSVWFSLFLSCCLGGDRTVFFPLWWAKKVYSSSDGWNTKKNIENKIRWKKRTDLVMHGSLRCWKQREMVDGPLPTPWWWVYPMTASGGREEK